MKKARVNLTIISISLYLLSLISFLLAYFQSTNRSIVFQLDFFPLNVNTNALVDENEETIAFNSLDQFVSISNLPNGILEMAIEFSGVFLTEPSNQSSDPFILSINNVEIPVSFSTASFIFSHWWFQMDADPVTLTMVNFVKIENERMYGAYLQDITIYHHPT